MPAITGDNVTFIDDLILDTQRDRFSLEHLYDQMIVQNPKVSTHFFKIAINDFFIKHNEELRPYVKGFHVGDNWFYRPKGVSYQIYGTTELWLALLRLNNMASAADFNKPIIMVYDPGGLKQIIDIYFQREGKTRFGR